MCALQFKLFIKFTLTIKINLQNNTIHSSDIINEPKQEASDDTLKLEFKYFNNKIKQYQYGCFRTIFLERILDVLDVNYSIRLLG